MSEDISTKQFLKEFEKKVIRMGGIPGAAMYWKKSESFLRAVAGGRELPGRDILKTMNLKPVKQIKYRYERVEL